MEQIGQTFVLILAVALTIVAIWSFAIGPQGEGTGKFPVRHSEKINIPFGKIMKWVFLGLLVLLVLVSAILVYLTYSQS